MARGKKAAKELSPEETLEQALIPVKKQPYPIPENWCYIPQKIICNLSNGEKKENTEYPYWDVKCLRGTKEADLIDSGRFIPSGTKVILVDGENSGEIFTILHDGYMGSTFRALNIVSAVFPDYLQYYVETKKELYKSNKRGSAVPHLNKELFFSMPFPLPPLPEQQRIVSRIESLFAKLDEAKEKAQAVVDSFELRKAAILHKAFTGELTERWRKAHGIGLDSWTDTTIGEQAELITKGASPRWQGVEYTDDKSQTLFITSENVREGYLDLTKEKYLNNQINDIQKRSILNYGDVLVNIVGASIGRAAIYNLHQLANTNQAVCIIRLKSGISNEFICLYLNSPTAQLYYYDNKVETARANISLKNISTMHIRMPKKNEQKEIIEILSTVLKTEQQTKEAAEAALKQIAAMKKVILARAFRGELGTNDPAEESAAELLKTTLHA